MRHWHSHSVLRQSAIEDRQMHLWECLALHARVDPVAPSPPILRDRSPLANDEQVHGQSPWFRRQSPGDVRQTQA